MRRAGPTSEASTQEGKPRYMISVVLSAWYCDRIRITDQAFMEALMAKYQVKYVPINKIGWAWVVSIRPGGRPVYSGQSWEGAIKFVNKKIARHKNLRRLLARS